MSHVPILCFFLTAGLELSSSLRILDRSLECDQLGLYDCKIRNCSDKRTVVPRCLAPTGPEWGPEHVGVGMDKHVLVPMMNVTWRLKSDASLLTLRGSEINILDESANQSLCVRYIYNISQQLTPIYSKWTFSLDGIAVEAGRTYILTVFNLPEPAIGDYKIRKQITIPGCDDRKLQTTQMCLENGSQWDPRVTTSLSVDKHKMFTVVEFEAAKYSDKYQVTVQSDNVCYSKNVSKDNRTSLIVTFELDLVQLPKCEIVLMIKPFFIRCRNDCCQPKVTIIDYCPYYPSRSVFVKATVGLGMIAVCLVYLLCTASRKDLVKTSTSAAKEQPESFQVQEKKRVFIIYSLDHHLYKNIVLKLCAFLGAKCGTEVVLDLLDSTRLGVMGNIQWLDWHREQITSSSNKILILCSRGVQAKWRAMCGEKEVSLREDVHSPVGDMLTPALSLIVPSFVQHASFETYIVAYFDDICSEEDVPSPFNITVRYKLMKQFEELFFRIIDTEKHQPGRINVLEGLAESEYHHCPAGRALRDAIQTFQAYQLEHPDWFEEELLNKSELEDEGTNTNTNHLTYHGYVSDSAQVLSHEETQDGDSVDDKAKFEMCSMRRCSQFD